MKYKVFKTAFTFKGGIKPNRIFFLFLFLILSISAGCGSTGVGSITGVTTSTSSGGATLTVTADKSKISFTNTEPFTLTATITCPAVPCLLENGGTTFSYSSSGIMSPAAADGNVTVDWGIDSDDANEVLTGTVVFQWSGIIPTARGTSIINVTSLLPALSTSITVKIE